MAESRVESKDGFPRIPALRGKALPDHRRCQASRTRLRPRSGAGRHDVAITFRTSARDAQQTVVDLSSFGVRAFALHCDIANEASVKSMMKEAGRELGRIDILVNDAANYDSAEFERLTLRQWDSIFASNTRGPFLVSREALKWMRRKSGSQRSARTPQAQKRSKPKSFTWDRSEACVPVPRQRPLLLLHAALHMLTKVMAKALAPEIAVNAVAPGDDRSRRNGGESSVSCGRWPSKPPCNAMDVAMKIACRRSLLRDRAAIHYRPDSSR